MTKDEVYESGMECDNCGDERTWDIPKGMLAKTFFETAICEHCECNVLLPVSDKLFPIGGE